MDEKHRQSGVLPKNCEDGDIERARAQTISAPSRKTFWCKAVILISFAFYLILSAINLAIGNAYSAWPAASRPRHKWISRQQVEELYLSVPSPESAILASRQFASKPHMAGTEGDRQTAIMFYDVLAKELGAVPPTPIPIATNPIYDAGSHESRSATLGSTVWGSSGKPTAWIDKYFPVMNTPLGSSLQLLGEDGGVAWEADLEEKADMTDPEAGEYKNFVSGFHGLSKDGSATGQLVYAGYGTKEDYDELVAKGTNLTGKIVLTKYGGIVRGLKIKGASDLGAVACLIYTDPADDGVVTVENGYAPYPEGPARNPTSVQRGSVQYISIYPGDPTTPGYPAYENATRVEATDVPDIPSLPLSWENAKVLLDEIKQGGMNRTVKMVNNVSTRVIPIWNTMGVIPGHIRDEVVVIGNHRDAWVMGATDPTSGTAAIHEMIRGLGTLMRSGWRPLRTIVIASWDAEEYGLMGSTEWGEDFADWISDHVVAYLNLDSAVSGSQFGSSASPSLAHLIRDTADKVVHPSDANRTLWDARHDVGAFTGVSGLGGVAEVVMRMHQLETGMASVDRLGVGVLGSGSDYTVFLQRIGVASTSAGFVRTMTDPAYHYHSIYDSVRWQEIYGDPGFFRHVAMAKHLGLQALTISDSVVLPFNTSHYAYELEFYVDKVAAIAGSTSLDLSQLRMSLHNLQAISLELDQEKARVEREFLRALKKWRDGQSASFFTRKIARSLCNIQTKLGYPCGRWGKLESHGRMLSSWMWQHAGERSYTLDSPDCGKRRPGGKLAKRLMRAAKKVRAVNQKLVAFDRGLISEEGLQGREWYTNLAVAPGLNLGYGATTLPGITEALTTYHNATLAALEVDRFKRLIDNLGETIRP